MSHCVACDIVLNTDRRWTVFNREYEGEVPAHAENLCSKCLEISRQSFAMSFRPIDEQIKVIQDFFYHDNFIEDDLTCMLQTIKETGSIQLDTEET